MKSDSEVLQLAKRILSLSDHLPKDGEQAQWRLAKIQDAARALVPRLEEMKSYSFDRLLDEA